jgi:hypothetical protein
LQRESLDIFQTLRPGDLVVVRHEVKVGFRVWQTSTTGRVVSATRRRHGLHRRRNPDDKVFSDVIVLQRPDGELTTVTLDDFTELRRVASPSATPLHAESDAAGPSAPGPGVR